METVTPELLDRILRPACRGHQPGLTSTTESHGPLNCAQHAFGRQESSISHRFRASKNFARSPIFTTSGATYFDEKFSPFRHVCMASRLCYYRQRSLKFFSAPCGCRKNLTKTPLPDRAESFPAFTDLPLNSPC